jgi:GNAT superfamily N-acetyltransferase
MPEKRYDYTWGATIDKSGLIQEGQTVVLVCFDAGQVVGHAALEVSVLRQRGEGEVTLAVHPQLVFVVPNRRGQGFGMDLSVAWVLVQDVLRALYRAVPARAVLSASVYADYESEGGEAFTNHLHACMEFRLDMLRDCGKRRTVQLGRSDLDGGY